MPSFWHFQKYISVLVSSQFLKNNKVSISSVWSIKWVLNNWPNNTFPKAQSSVVTSMNWACIVWAVLSVPLNFHIIIQAVPLNPCIIIQAILSVPVRTSVSLFRLFCLFYSVPLYLCAGCRMYPIQTTFLFRLFWSVPSRTSISLFRLPWLSTLDLLYNCWGCHVCPFTTSI